MSLNHCTHIHVFTIEKVRHLRVCGYHNTTVEPAALKERLDLTRRSGTLKPLVGPILLPWPQGRMYRLMYTPRSLFRPRPDPREATQEYSKEDFPDTTTAAFNTDTVPRSSDSRYTRTLRVCTPRNCDNVQRTNDDMQDPHHTPIQSNQYL
jgi:hypothetical protein